MRCPKCADFEMLVELHGETIIHRCPTCRGVFLEKGKLTKILHGGLAKEIDPLDFNAVATQMDLVAAACPRCDGEVMDALQGPADVRIDRCPRCGSLFLDQGDLSTIAFHRE